MKKIIVHLAISLFLFVICNNATAVYTDVAGNLGLMHCDNTYTSWWGAPNTNSYWLVTPDDNSSGRDSCLPVLNMAVQTFDVDTNGIPTLEPGSPYGGKYLSFNGTSDSIKVVDNTAAPWQGDPTLSLDISFRWKGLPSTNDMSSLIWEYPWKCYFFNRENGGENKGKVSFMLYTGAEEWFDTTKFLSSNVWYNLYFKLFDNKEVVSIIGNVSEGYTTNTGTLIGDLDSTANYPVIIGNDFFAPTRFFHGDVDEVRWGWAVPEPAILGLLSLLGIAFLRRK